MKLKRRALAGAPSAPGGTPVLAGMHRGPEKAGPMETSAPDQVTVRAEDPGPLEARSPEVRRAFPTAARFDVATRFGHGAGWGSHFRALTRGLGGERP